jgi:hypothetical protein
LGVFYGETVKVNRCLHFLLTLLDTFGDAFFEGAEEFQLRAVWFRGSDLHGVFGIGFHLHFLLGLVSIVGVVVGDFAASFEQFQPLAPRDGDELRVHWQSADEDEFIVGGQLVKVHRQIVSPIVVVSVVRETVIVSITELKGFAQSRALLEKVTELVHSSQVIDRVCQGIVRGLPNVLGEVLVKVAVD